MNLKNVRTHGNHKNGDIYFWSYGSGYVTTSIWHNGGDHEMRYAIGNCYKTREEAEQAIEILKIHNELKHYAEEHNEAEIDWSNDQRKYYISNITLGDDDIDIDWNQRIKRPNQIYFTSHEIAEDAIKAIGEDRVKMWLKA